MLEMELCEICPVGELVFNTLFGIRSFLKSNPSLFLNSYLVFNISLPILERLSKVGPYPTTLSVLSTISVEYTSLPK